MNILAIDTSGQAASVAIVSDKQVVAEFALNHKINHSVTIMPLLHEMLRAVGMETSDMDYIASACGPGSFTGLRIGASAAKALAHASGKKLVPVSTLLGLAYNVLVTDKIIVPVMDAKRDQVYAAAYTKTNGKPVTLLETTADDINNVINIIKEHNKSAVFVGDGVIPYEKRIVSAGYDIAPQNCNLQRASSIGLAALELIKIDKFVNYDEFDIHYARKPQAEREAVEKVN